MKRVNIKFLLIFVFTVLLTLLYQYETILTYFDSVNIPATEKMCQNVPVKIKLKSKSTLLLESNFPKFDFYMILLFIRRNEIKLSLSYLS